MNTFDLISDLHKDTRGFHPTSDWMNVFNDTSYEELHRRAEEHALAVFERRLEDMMADYNIDLPTALRWDMESFEVDVNKALVYHGTASQEIEFYLWKQGIAFSDFARFTAMAYEAHGLNQYGARTEEAT